MKRTENIVQNPPKLQKYRTNLVETYRHNARLFISYRRSGYTYSFNVATIIGPTKERLFSGFKDIFQTYSRFIIYFRKSK